MSAPKQAPFPHPLIFGLIVQYAAIRRGRRGCDSRHSSQPVGEGHAPVVAVRSLACEGRRAHGGPQRERSLAVLERLEAGAEGPPVRDQERRVDRDDALLALDDVGVDEGPGSPER
jgi:hypothetical protein